MTLLEKQEFLRKKYGDKVDEMSNSDIESLYNQETHQISDDAIQNQPRLSEQTVLDREFAKTSIPAGTASPVEFNEMQAAAKAANPAAYENKKNESYGLSLSEAMGGVINNKPPVGNKPTGSTSNKTSNKENKPEGPKPEGPKPGGPPSDTGGNKGGKYKNKYTYGPKSILKAYYDEDIDPSTRDYLIADVLAKFARNTGKDIGNIGAQFSGGTVDNSRETSDWEERNAEILKQQTSAQAAKIKNSDKAMERAMQKIEQTAGQLKNEQAGYTLSAAERLEELYDETNDPMLKNMYAVLMSDVSDGNISQGALIGIAAASTPAEIKHIARDKASYLTGK